MLYFSFTNPLMRGIDNLFQGFNRIIQTIVTGGTPRAPRVGLNAFEPRPFAEISGIHFFLIVVSALFLVLVIYLVIKHRQHMIDEEERMSRYFIKPTAQHMHETRWSKVEQLFSSQNESEWRLGIIEADAMLEDLTLQLGYPGMNLGERLKSINPRNFPLLQQAWHVHLLRNRIAHEGMTFNLPQHEAWRAFKIYENIFRGYGYTG
jgi:hypothetical protein